MQPTFLGGRHIARREVGRDEAAEQLLRGADEAANMAGLEAHCVRSGLARRLEADDHGVAVVERRLSFPNHAGHLQGGKEVQSWRDDMPKDRRTPNWVLGMQLSLAA